MIPKHIMKKIKSHSQERLGKLVEHASKPTEQKVVAVATIEESVLELPKEDFERAIAAFAVEEVLETEPIAVAVEIDIEEMTKKELLAELAKRNVVHDKYSTRKDLIELLRDNEDKE